MTDKLHAMKNGWNWNLYYTDDDFHFVVIVTKKKNTSLFKRVNKIKKKIQLFVNLLHNLF